MLTHHVGYYKIVLKVTFITLTLGFRRCFPTLAASPQIAKCNVQPL